MRILYAALGAGNGHLSRAEEILPHLQKHGEVDIAVSGTDAQVKLADSVKHNHHGLIFHLGKRGSIDYWRTFKDLKVSALVKDIRDFPIDKYDCVVNDFEPITARSAKKKQVPIVSLSHQASFASKNTPRPARFLASLPAEFILKKYAPCEQKIGIHFEEYDEFIRTPVIRSSVRKLTPSNQGHICVYLPGFDDQYLIEFFRKMPDKKWHIFSKRSKQEFSVYNSTVSPVSLTAYTHSLAGCDGLLTGGGFEAPAEAIFLGKKLIMVPLAGQFEQQCNAAAAARLGVKVLETVGKDQFAEIYEWARNGKPIHIHYPDNAGDLVAEALRRAAN
jgi:uncharacterized protein (TIGR00661 family)